MPSTSAPPTPLFPTSGNKALCLPSQLPMRSSCLKSAGLDGRFDDLKTPLTPPAAYMEFLRSAIVVKTPTSAKFDFPPTSAPPLSAGCTCHLQRVTIIGKKPGSSSSRESSTSSISSLDSASSTRSLSSASSASSACSCSNEHTYGAPPTPCTPGPLMTPRSGTKRLRIPPSPAFSSPGFGSGHAFCDSPLPIYSTVPRTPIAEESEEDEDEKEASPRQRRRIEAVDRGIKSAGLTESHPVSCRHHHLVRRVLVPRASSGLARTARMNLMPAPKGKKRRAD